MRIRRLEAGLSQKELAALVGCDHRTISRLEQGHQSRTPGLIERINQVLDERKLPYHKE